MNIFGKRFDVAALQAQLDESTATINRLNASHDKLLAEVGDYKRTIASFVGVKAGYEDEMKQLVTQHAEAVDKLNKEIASVTKSTNRKVNMTLAKMGVNEFAPEEITNTSTMNAKSVYGQWQSLNGYEKGKYFKAHQQVIEQFRKENLE